MGRLDGADPCFAFVVVGGGVRDEASVGVVSVVGRCNALCFVAKDGGR